MNFKFLIYFIMKKVFLVFLVLLVSLLSRQYISAQGLKVVYEEVSNLYSGRDPGKDYEHIENPEVRAYHENRAKAPTVRSSELLVNRGVSLYKMNKEPEKTETASLEGERFQATMTFNRQRNSVLSIYKNYMDSVVLTQSSMDNKVYLLESPIVSGKNADWEITSEQQNILGYNCIKAMGTVGQAMKIGDMEAKPHKVVAWYCPDIPVDAGPHLHGGLPGLILKVEMDEGVRVFTAISIETVDPATEIPKPEEGEKVSDEQFLAIASEYLARQLEQIKRAGGNVRIIQR
jgi:GLPGLI family protein